MASPTRTAKAAGTESRPIARGYQSTVIDVLDARALHVDNAFTLLIAEIP